MNGTIWYDAPKLRVIYFIHVSCNSIRTTVTRLCFCYQVYGTLGDNGQVFVAVFTVKMQNAKYLFIVLICSLIVVYFIYDFHEILVQQTREKFQTPDTCREAGSLQPSEIVKTNTSANMVLIPDDETLNNMSEIQQMEFYLKYVNTLQALCRNFIRVGSLTDGGKEICIDEDYRPKAPCLVYSFGINNQWDFDNMIVDLFGCEVHCFDPSMKRETGKVSDKVWFYKVGISDKDWVNDKQWEMKTLATIRRDLKHENRTIDILKIDVEEAEWKAIPQMIDSGAADDIKQMAVELHFPERAKDKPKNWRDEETNMHLFCLRRIYEAGYRLVMRDRNIYNIRKLSQFKYPITLLYEVTLVKEKV